MFTLANVAELLRAGWRPLLAASLMLAAVLLVRAALRVAGGVLPRAGLLAAWLRGFRLSAIGVGCAAVGAGLLGGHTWLIAVGLAFACEETMETSVCLSALAASRERPEPCRQP